MARHVFLLGAGASFGSDRPPVPPLMADLLEELRRRYPSTWGSVPSDLADGFRHDFELGMQECRAADAALADQLQRAMASYFFEFIPRATNVYVALAKRILAANWDGAMVTLNYERLLELAFWKVGVGVDRGCLMGGRYIGLCLPHGHCNLFINMVLERIRLPSKNMKADSQGPPRFIDAPCVFEERIQRDSLPPVMCYIEPRKETRTGDTFIIDQRQKWMRLTQEAESIAVIGVGLHEHDSHIWAPLARTPARVVYCAGTTGAAEFNAWAEKCRAGRGDTVLQGYFRDEFETICTAMGL